MSKKKKKSEIEFEVGLDGNITDYNKKKDNNIEFEVDYNGNINRYEQQTLPKPKQKESSKKNSFIDATKKLSNTINNSFVKNNGLNISNAITDITNIRDDIGNIKASLPVVGNYLKAKNKVDKTILNTATNMGEGALRTAEGILDTANNLSDKVNNAGTYVANRLINGKEEADKQLKKAKEKSRKFIEKDLTTDLLNATDFNDEEFHTNFEEASLVKRDNIGGQIAQDIGGMVPSLLAGQYLGLGVKTPNTALKGLKGLDKAKALAKNLAWDGISNLGGTTALAGSTYGQSLQEAYQNGATDDQATRYAIGSTSKEIVTEWITGGIPGLDGTGGLDKPVEKLIDKTTGKLKNEYAKAISKSLMSYGYKFVGEGIEEGLSEIIDPYLKNATYSKDEKVNWEDVLNSFIVGGITGGILEAPNSVIEFNNNIVEANNNILQNNATLPTGNNQNITNDVKDNPLIVNNSSVALPVGPNTMEQINNSKNFIYEASNNSKIDIFRKSASQFMNNSNETKSFVQTVEKVINDKNYNVTFDNTIGDNVNGRISINENGEVDIRINPNSDRAGEFILTHEITHAIDNNEMRDLVIDYAKKSSEFNVALESLKQTYSVDDVNDEVLADISGQLFGNQEFINKLSTSKPNIFKRIYDKIISFANKITGNSKESLFIKDLKNKWEKAYREANIDISKENIGEAKYSIKKNNQGKSYIEIDTDQDIFKNIRENDYNKIAKMYINDYLKGISQLGKNDNAIIDSKTAKKYTNPGKRQNYFIEKMRLTPELKNVLAISEKVNSMSPVKVNSKYNSWEYYKFDFNLDGKKFNALLNIGIDSNGNKHLYEVNNINEKRTDGISETSLNSPISSHKDNISQNDSKINSNVQLSSKYSMQNLENNTDWQEHLEKNYKSTGTKTNFENTRFKEEKNKYLDPTKESSYGVVRKKKRKNKQIYNASKIIEYSDYNHQEAFKNIVSTYNKDTSLEQIKKDVENHFKEKKKSYISDTIDYIKYLIGRNDINVPDTVKEKFSSFSNFAKNNAGDIRFNKNGRDIIDIYNELSKKYPSVFKNNFYDEMANKIDSNKDTLNVDELDILEDKRLDDVRAKMLNRLSEFIHEDENTYSNYNLENDALNQAANYIYNSIQNNENIDDLINDFNMSPKQIRKEKTAEYRELASSFISSSGQWKDKSMGLSYKVNTMKRNFYDIMGKRDGEVLYSNFIEPIFQHNAEMQQDISRYNERVSKLNLNEKESTAVQMLGEYKYNPETLVTGLEVDEFISSNNLDHKKLENAVEEFRNIYDELLEKTNNVLRSQGMKEIDYREGYFPHFVEEHAKTKLGKLLEKTGWKFNNDSIPTDIAGMTEMFKPGKTWNKNAQQRKGKYTDFNVLQGYDNYIRGMMNNIYFTEDIQKLRALENEIRYEHSPENIKNEINKVLKDSSLSFDDRQLKLEEIYSRTYNPLNNFVSEIRDYTNNIANKKSILDRTIEQSTNRKVYSVMQNVSNRLSANMVGLNLSSAITNFIPITQATSQVKSQYLLKGLKEAIKNQAVADNFESKSVFLTTRLNEADKLYKTKLESFSEKANFMFDGIDSITANTIVRGKYHENIANGMSEYNAIRNADEFARDLMAGRSKGEMPTIFNSKNPLIKLFTAFQLEVNNQYQYMFKDLPRDLGDEAKKKLIAAFIKMFFGAWIYNQLTEKVIGRKAAFSPMDTLKEIYDTSTNRNIDISSKSTNILKSLTQDIPFIGSLVGGGRLPISSALPNKSNITKDVSKIVNKKTKNKSGYYADIAKELGKPVFFIGLPFGGGQIKKSLEGASLYVNKKEIKGSYNASGALKFEAKTNPSTITKNILFGQSSSKEAQDYYNNGYLPIDHKTLEKLQDKGVTISEYRRYSDISKELGLSEIKSDKDSEDKPIKGTASAKKAYKIMNSNYSNKEKNYLLSTLSSKDESAVSLKEIENLQNDQKTYKFYFGLNSDGRKKFRSELDSYNISSDQLIDFYNTRKEYNNTYTSNIVKEKIINYLSSSNLDEKTKWYLYSKDYGNKNLSKIVNTFNIKSEDYFNVVKYSNDISSKYQGDKNSSRRKQLVFNYIDSLKINNIQKTILFKQAGYTNNSGKKTIFNYIDSMKISKTEKQKLYNSIF